MGRLKLSLRFNIQHALDCLNRYQTPHKACFEGHFSFLTLLKALREAKKTLHVRHAFKCTLNPSSEYSCENDPILSGFLNTLNNSKTTSHASISFSQACHLMDVTYDRVKYRMNEKKLIPITYWTIEDIS